eukprot:gene9536-biopygen668
MHRGKVSESARPGAGRPEQQNGEIAERQNDGKVKRERQQRVQKGNNRTAERQCGNSIIQIMTNGRRTPGSGALLRALFIRLDRVDRVVTDLNWQVYPHRILAELKCHIRGN